MKNKILNLVKSFRTFLSNHAFYRYALYILCIAFIYLIAYKFGEAIGRALYYITN